MSALVVLTPSVAFGVAAGLDAASGIYAAVAVGIFVGVFERERPQFGDVSSVTAIPMAVVVATYADSLGKALTIVMLAGLMQVVLGLLRLARFVAYTPYSVIAGFTSGVGVLIIVSMVRSFLGQTVWITKPATAVRDWPEAFADVDFAALAIGALTLAVALTWPKRLRTKVPPMLAGLAAGTLLSVLWLRDVATLDDLPTGLPELAAPVLSPGFLAEAVTPALTIALLSTVRALLSILAADAQTRTQLDPDRSLVSLGAGNIAAGMVGARQFERLQLDSVVSVPLLDQVFLTEQSVASNEIAPYSARTGIVKLRGSFTVASSSKLIRTIGDDIVGHEVVILDFSETEYMDDSAALVIEQLIDAASAEDVHCIVMALGGEPAATLESLNVLRRIPPEHKVSTLDEAREATRRLLG